MSRENASRLQPIAPRGWPERIIELAELWTKSPRTQAQDPLLSDLWLLLNAALMKYLRIHSGRNPSVRAEDLQDLAAEKTLDLFEKFDRGVWDPTTSSPAQLCSFISTLARNGLVDHLRTRGGKRFVDLDAAHEFDAVEARVRAQWHEAASDDAVDRGRFAQALRDCALRLKPKARKMWFLRVFYEMKTKEIATHPAIGMKPGAVDVSLQRCREQIRECMRSKGFDSGSVPHGTFAVLWETFRSLLDGPR